MTEERLVRSGRLARLLSVNRSTVVKWWHDGLITPEYVTPFNEPRWNVARVRAELARKHGNAPPPVE